jgi:hypothetical protein
MTLIAMVVALSMPAQPPTDEVILRTRQIEWVIGADGRNLRFTHRKTGRNLLNPAGSVAFFARVAEGIRLPSRVRRERDRISVDFGEGLSAQLAVRETPDAVVMDVISVTGPVEELTFGQATLSLGGNATDPVEVCALARNVVTNVPELPGASSILRAMAYRRLGFAGASAAFVTASKGSLRQALQKAVTDAPELPKSPIGGPWALDSPNNRRSYLFNFGDLNVASARPWIELAHALGAGQIDFHGGTSFRFGDFEPDPKTYPGGLADLKATVDALHAAGLQAGLHTYAFFIDKRSKYVTPVPDKRLASARTFTLAEPVDAAGDTITVVEPTTGVTATTGFFVTNSATLRIGEELVTFREATQQPPYRFLGCTRGALGTKASAHEAGAKADHLKELFGLFAPDAESDLFLEIIENTARTYNECGFDMIYLDALDGSYIHAGPEWAWYYGARFVYELVKRLKKPAIMEMSTFHHHLWCVRARMGAWDAARTGYKEFVDMHRVVNRDCERMYLPSHLGWWGVFGWNGIQPERTLPDDLEYLMVKALADDAGVSFVQGFRPESFPKSPGAQRYAAMIRRYEDVRRSGDVPAALRRKLAAPGAEFTLTDGPKGKRAFVPVRYEKRDAETGQAAFSVANPFAAQPLAVRIEARLGVAADAPSGAPLLAPGDAVSEPRCAEGVSLKVRVDGDAVVPAPGEPPARCLALSATSVRKERRGAWACIVRTLPEPVDMTRKGLGVWVYGDGRGQVLNFQLQQPDNLGPGVAEHYLVVDFTGWRFCRLIEPESDRLSRFSWPYAAHRSEWERNPGLAFTSAYKTYHPWLNYTRISALAVWLNEQPEGPSEVRLGPVVPVPLVTCSIVNPTVAVGGAAITFPVTLESGQYLEWHGSGTARLYGPENEEVRIITPTGRPPALVSGDNALSFACEAAGAVGPRARITVILKDRPVRF